MAVKVAEEWFTICAGCEITILDIGEYASSHGS
jgi:coenzyme F420-reducing hydrogenase gamma subunit